MIPSAPVHRRAPPGQDPYAAAVDLRERHTGNARRHPWEVVRSGFFRSVVSDHLDLQACGRVLDIGAGDGWFADQLRTDLSPDSEIVCWDVNYSADDLAALSPEGLHRTTEAPAGTFDLVLLLDVLEHVADDAGFLADEVTPRLHADSVLVVSVPAYQALFSAHDHALGHERRYRPRALRTLLAERYGIIERGGLFISLLPLRVATKLAERLPQRRTAAESAGIGDWRGGEALTRALVSALALDARACKWMARRRVVVPGLSTWAVCRPMAQNGRR
jgi:SAM-dependent methyltransferase